MTFIYIGIFVYFHKYINYNKIRMGKGTVHMILLAMLTLEERKAMQDSDRNSSSHMWLDVIYMCGSTKLGLCGGRHCNRRVAS
jgi:hypothetical protein